MITLSLLGFFVITAILMVVLANGKGVVVFVFDRYNKIKKCHGRKSKDGKIIFRYNQASKAGIASEENSYDFNRRESFFYTDINGTLLPIKYNVEDKELNLSTSQEKHYEVEAKRAIAKKTNNTIWGKYKEVFISFGLMGITALVCIIMITSARDIEPIDQPQIDLVYDCINTLKNVSETNYEEKQATNKLIETFTNTKESINQPIPK